MSLDKEVQQKHPYIDIHSHCIPGVDDGAKTMQEALAIARLAEQGGCGTIITTPHHHPRRGHAPKEELLKQRNLFQQELARQGIDVKLYTGQELYYDSETAEKLRNGQVMTMAESDYVLIEFGFTDPYKKLPDAVREMQREGYLPIIAHIERYDCILEEPERAAELYDMGAYIQVNADSILDHHGRATKKLTKYLLKNQLVHFIASDAHDTTYRKPRFEELVGYLDRKYKGMSEILLHENPMKIIHKEYI
jgi:protein-tyrosine phosphatase